MGLKLFLRVWTVGSGWRSPYIQVPPKNTEAGRMTHAAPAAWNHTTGMYPPRASALR